MQTLYFFLLLSVSDDVLETLEAKHDWATFEMTWELFVQVFTQLIPDVIMHTSAQDESQIRDHYDRGNDFYSWFLGPRMIYTSGVVTDETRKETLEELQDNKLALVCHKLELQPEDTLLDIGCGWGALTTYAGKNFGCDVTGVTLAKEQAKFCQDRLNTNGWVQVCFALYAKETVLTRLKTGLSESLLIAHAFSAWMHMISPMDQLAAIPRLSL